MKQYKLNQVFLDTENFNEPKRLKCVGGTACVNICAYWKNGMCHKIACVEGETNDGANKYFIETTEPMSNLNTLLHTVLKMLENDECEDLSDEELEQISILIHRPTTMGREDAAKFMGVSLNRLHELRAMGVIPEPRKVKGQKEKMYYTSDLSKALRIKKERGL